MNPDDVVALLKAIAEALTPTAQAAWEIYLRQVYVDAAVNLFWGVLCAGGIVLLIGKIRTLLQRARDTYHVSVEEVSEGWAFAGAILAVVLALVMVLCMTAAVKGLANPEYQAIEMLLSVGVGQ
jgi:hypothetical protein